MRDVFMTTRSFVKRLHALLRYRQALRDMNKYPDATAEELGREDTCIICREEMQPWDAANPGQVERSRPKKLPCGHILHFGCLKSWLERQQVCPTCRRPVVLDAPQPGHNGDPLVFRFGLNFPARNPGQQPPANGAAPGGGQVAPAGQGGQNGGQNDQQGNQNARVRMFNLGPVRIGFAQGDEGVIRDMAQQMGLPPNAANPPAAAGEAAVQDQDTNGVLDVIRDQLADVNQRVVTAGQRVQQDMHQLQVAEAQLSVMNVLLQEMARLNQMGQALQQHVQQQPQQQQQNGAQPHTAGTGPPPVQAQPQPQFQPQPPQHPHPFPQPYPAAFYPAGVPGHYGPAPAMQAINPFAAARIQAPTVTRHGGASAAIPAGSPDLPEGVVIPPGWSLLPLRRLDDGTQPQIPATGLHQAQAPQQGSTMVDPAHMEMLNLFNPPAQRAAGSGTVAGQGSTTATGTPQPQAPQPADPADGPLRSMFFNQFTARQVARAGANGTAMGPSSTAAAYHPTEQEPRGRSPPTPSSSHPTEELQTERPPVTAPTPLLPNWGGPSQLFGGGASGARDTAASTPIQEQHDEETTAEQNGSSDGKAAGDKGKAKAVTVEDDESEDDT